MTMLRVPYLTVVVINKLLIFSTLCIADLEGFLQGSNRKSL